MSTLAEIYKRNNIAKATTQSSLPSVQTNNYITNASNYKDEESANNGGFLGGVGYVAEKFGLGVMSSLEGVLDYAAGTIAKLIGADEWAEEQFANDWMNYNHADEWFDPGEGWKVAGDVFGGIGTSVPSIAASFVPGVGIGLSIAVAGLSAAGNATKEAYRQTGELGGKEFGYGALVGATEAGVELLTAGLGKGTGRIITEAQKKATGKAATVLAKFSSKTIFKELTEDFISEAIEEGLAGAVSPFYARMTYDENAELATAKEIGYAALVGGLSGLLMSGTRSALLTGSNYRSGKKAVDDGRADKIMEVGRQIAEYENKDGGTDIEAYKTVKSEYDELVASLEKTGGKVETTKQKMLLGALEKANIAAIFDPFIERGAEASILNADAIAKTYSELGAKDSAGNPITFTADQIRSGVDPALLYSENKALRKEGRKQLLNALKSNSTLATLAVMQATGNIIMDAEKLSTAARNGAVRVTDDNLRILKETASDAQKNELARELGYDSLDGFMGASGDDVRARIEGYLFKNGDKIRESAGRIKLARTSFAKNSESRYNHNTENKNDNARLALSDTPCITIESSSELAQKIAKSDKSKYTVISDYLFENFGGEQFVLSDGRKATIDKRDANKLASKANEARTAQLANLKKIVEEAKFSHNETNVVHKKFSAFYYYAIDVKYDEDTFKLWLNVGVAKNDGVNHIYALTNRAEEASTNNGVSRPVGNALQNASPINSIPQNSKNSNSNLENTLQEKGISYKPLPKSFKSNMADGAYIFNEAGENIGIIKEKDSFYVYDYSSDKISKPLSVTEINKTIKEAKEKSSISIKMESVDNTSNDYSESKTENDDNNFAQMSEQSNEIGYELSQNTNAYTDKEIESITKDEKNSIAKTFSDVLSFITDSIGTKGTKRLFLGKLKISTASKVKIGTNIHVYGKSLVLTSDELRHLFAQHGNMSSEALRGQEAITKDNFDKVVDAVLNPDNVTSSADSSGTITLVFEKSNNGKTTAVTIVSEKKKALTLKSAWITKKGQHISPPSDVQAPNQTPNSELSMNAVPNNSISQTSENINSNEKKSSDNSSNVTDSGETKLDAAAIGTWARENVKGYASLPEPSKRAVRDTIRQARAHGIPDNEIVIAARVAARSGLNVVYDKISIEGDGKYNGRNTVYIDPKAPKERRCARLLLHEGGHALKGEKGFIKLLARATKLVSPDKAKEIRDKYTEYYKSKKIDKEVYEPIIEEEIAMAAIEETLGVDGAWDYILSKKPSISEKFLSFFRGAARDYSDLNELSKEARKLLREYKKIFDAFAEKNRGNNANTDARIADGERLAIKYPLFSAGDISTNMNKLAEMSAVAKIDESKLNKTGKAPSDIFNEYFASLGNYIYSDVFGDISLGKSSVKAEIRHGITATKIASIEAIPQVIKYGKVIFHGKKDGGVERIVVCAPIKIADENYYMGVMLQRDAQTQYLYLHNVAIEREMPNDSKTHLVTTGVNEDIKHLSITSILQKAIDVKIEKQNSKISTLSVKKDTGDRLALPNNSDPKKIFDAFAEKNQGNNARTDARIADGERLALSYTTDNRAIAIIENDIFNGKFDELSDSQRIKIVKEVIKKFRPGVPISGRLIKISRKTAGHFTNSDYTDKIRNNDTQLYEDKLNVAQNIDDVIYAATNYINEDLKHERDDNIIQFARGKVLLQIGEKKYQADVLVGYTSMHDMILYDVQDLTYTTFDVKEKKAQPKLAGNKSYTRKTVVPSNSSIPQSTEKSTLSVKKDTGERFAISTNLDSDLDSVLNGTFDASKNEVYIGTTSNFMTDVIGAEGLELYMPAAKAYSALVTEAEYNKKPYYKKQDNYHGIGKEKFIEILEKSESPIAAFAAAPDEDGNKRLNRIVLVTDEMIKDIESDTEGYAVVVEEVDTTAIVKGKRVRANKSITVYPRTQLKFDIEKAIIGGRLLDITKKGEHLFAGVRGSNPQAAIQKDVLKRNIADFWANVKWLKEKNKKNSSSQPKTVTPMQAALQKSGYIDQDGHIQYTQNSKKDVPSAKKDTGDRLALPNNSDPDKVTISKVELAKIKANYRSDKVFNKKDVEIAMKKIDAFSDIPLEDRKKIITDICIGLNERVDEQHLETFTELSYYRIRAEIEQLRGFDLTREELSVMDTQIKTALKDILDSGRPSAKSKIRETVKAEEYAKELNRDLRKYKKEIRDAAKQREISKETTEKRNSVRRKLGMLNTKLLKPTKTKNVPWWMASAVADALKSFDIRSQNLVELANVEEAIVQEKKRTVPDESKLIKLENKRVRLETATVNARFEISALYEAYESLSNPSNDDAVKNEYSQDVAERLKGLKAITGNTPLAEMSLEQLEAFDEFITMFSKQAENSRTLLAEEGNRRVSESAEAAIAEIEQVKVPSLFNPRKGEWVVGSQIRKYLWKALKPMEVFEVIGSAELKKQALEIFAAEHAYGKFIAEAKGTIERIAKNNNYDKYRKDMDERKPFKLANGKTVKISLSELMSLFAWGRRESANTHLEGLGFVFASDATYKGKNETKEGFSLRLERMINDSERYELSPEDFANISAALPEDLRNFVVEMQNYLSGHVAEEGNKISKKLYGIELFKEKNYFPMKCAKEWIDSEVSKTGDPKLKNMGMTKALAPDAKNPLVLQGFMDIFSAHINNMALYTSFVIPLEDFYRILNYRSMGDIENVDSTQNDSTSKKSKEASSLKAVIKEKYGEEAVRYIEQFLRDLNGGIVNSKPLDLMDKGIRNFKFAATAASLSTAIQQPTSIIRAQAIIEPKYFPPMLLMDKSGARWEELKEYAPIAVIKEMGGFDTGVGRSILEYLDEANYKGLEKIKGFVSDSEYRNKVFGLLATKMDKMGWVTIWEACKRKVKDKHPDLAIDSEALLEKAGGLFTKVIQETQVYDSTLSRSEMMRSKDTGWKMATAFAAEPLTIFNMFVRAYVKKSRGQEGSGKIIKSLIAASIVNVLLSSLVYAARDDDEDEAYLEKYVEAVSDKMLDTINPLNLLPFARDVVSIIEGYDIERTDMAVIADIVNSYRRLTSSGEVTYGKAIDFIASTVQAIGIPGKNILRDARGMYNVVYSAFDDEVPTWEGIKNAHKEGVKSPFFFNEKRIDQDLKNANQLYEAAVSGNTKHYDRVVARYEDKDSALSALRSAMRDNDKRIEAAAQAKISGDIETYQKLISEIVSDGHFERSFVTRAVTSEYLAIRRELEEYGNVVFVGDIAYTLSEEETKALEEQKLSLTNEVAHLSESNIYRKLSDDQRDIALVYAEDLIADAAESAVLGVDNGKNALLANIIGINNVAMLYALTKDLESDKDENGKTISGTKKRKIIAAIKSLGLSAEEQLLLLCAKGYSIGSDNLTKKRLLNYIIKLKNVTKEDKLRLAEMCGFQVKNGRIVQSFAA